MAEDTLNEKGLDEEALEVAWRSAFSDEQLTNLHPEQVAQERECARDIVEAYLSAASGEGQDWREEAWRCYVESGADPDGADARHLNPGEAVAAVKELRLDYNRVCDGLPSGEGLTDEEREAVRELANEAASAVSQPTRFQQNVGHCQQRLSQAVAKVRLALSGNG